MKHEVVNPGDWEKARLALLEKEKKFTRLRDEISAERRALPWTILEKNYTFDSNEGSISFAQLFNGKSQLIVYHFMFGPDWDEEGCKSCSFWADHYNSIIIHLKQRDVNMIAISRAPLGKINAFKARQGWSFDWFSSLDNDFNFDFHVTSFAGKTSQYNYKEWIMDKESEMPGISVFYKDEEDNIYHTYSCFARELETYNTAYRYLDLVPKGRDENDLPFGMAWVKHKYKY